VGTRYKDTLCVAPSIDLSLDVSRMAFDDGFFARMAPAMEKAYAAMDALEKGAIANPDEKRMVGHYWLRDPKRAPAGACEGRSRTRSRRSRPSRRTSTGGASSSGSSRSASAARPSGPMFVADALGDRRPTGWTAYFIDNTDPDGLAASALAWTASSARRW
jgi:glucose-6-phosphate isomerase